MEAVAQAYYAAWSIHTVLALVDRLFGKNGTALSSWFDDDTDGHRLFTLIAVCLIALWLLSNQQRVTYAHVYYALGVVQAALALWDRLAPYMNGSQLATTIIMAVMGALAMAEAQRRRQ